MCSWNLLNIHGAPSVPRRAVGLLPFKLDFVKCSESEFVSFWAKRYNEGKYSDSIYEKNLNKGRKLEQDNIEPLLAWKNGRPLPPSKKKFVPRVARSLPKFNDFRFLQEVTKSDEKQFWNVVCNIVESGLVWRVFLLHIARPDDYPIVDQHVLRAQSYLTHGQPAEPSMTFGNYESYVAFFNDLSRSSGQESRQVDKALMSFGQFLKSRFYGSGS